MFGFGAGNEDCGRDVEREAVELLLARDVLDGFVGEAAKDAAVVEGLLAGRQWAGGIGVDCGSGDTQGVEQQEQRVALGVGAEVGGGFELGCGSGESFAAGEGSRCQRSVLSVSMRCG
jgi:hypothetical protein